MDCPECDEPLDVSSTKPNMLRCRHCQLLFVVKENDELQGIKVKAPDGMGEEEFFESFTENLGFVDD